MPSRKWWFILGGLAILLLVAVVALPLLVDVNRYRGLIQAKAEEALGREVGLGEMSLSLMPFGVRVDSLSIGALPEEGGGEFLTAQSVQVGARLMPLLRKRLEVTSIRVVAPEMTLSRGADGRWNVQRLAGTDESAGPSDRSADPTERSATGFLVSSLRLTDGRVHVRDSGPARTAPLEFTLDQVDLQLTDLALDRPVEFEFAANVGSEPTTTLRLSGRAGPLVPADGQALGVTAQIDVKNVDANRLGSWFEGTALPQGLRVERPFNVTAKFETVLGPESRIDTVGTFGVDGAVVSFARPDGTRREVPIDLSSSYDFGLLEAGAHLDLRKLEVDLAGNTLAVAGSVRREEPLQRVDLRLQPSRVPADELAKLMALIAIDLPVTFASKSPVEFEGRLHGLVGQDHAPEIEASLRVADFTLNHPTMGQPIEQVGASIKLRGERVEVTGLQGVVGSSDVAGRVTLDGFAAPRVDFDLHSKRADFGELFSFLDQESPPASQPTASGSAKQGAAEEDSLAKMTLRGRLRIDQGTFQKLDFSRLEATMVYVDSVLTLDPLTMQLYDGEFKGRIESNLAGDQPTFAVRGDTTAVDLNAFISDNLEISGVIAGRFSGKLETRGAGTDYATILRSLEGAGSVEVTEGQLGKLNVLDRISSVSGLFGENTLRSLTKQLATEGTEFRVLSGDMQLGGGNMRVENLLFDAGAFKLGGKGVVDLLSTELDGEFRLSFSPEVSASMRSEKSQAARAFWNSSTRRVELPLTLKGPFTAPMPGIDFEAVVENLAKSEVRDYISKRLGLSEEQPEASPQATQSSGGASSTAPPENRSHPEMSISFERPNWRGNFLARDLELTGTVSGTRIDRASLSVVDSEGRQFENIARLPEVDAYVASAASRDAAAAIAWRILVDGKQLLRAHYPVTLTVTVLNIAGESAQSVLKVDR
jgi:uncharacterized protein involved in outer membrane biogenesis